jgi:hypothetical protein
MGEGQVSPFTPTQQRLLDALADGLPHAPAELAALIDSQATIENLWSHLSYVRIRLRKRGEDILAVYHNRTLHYRHVRLLAPVAVVGGT